MERHVKIVVWARDRASCRATLEPLRLMYGGTLDEHGLSGLRLVDGLSAPVQVHILPLANLSARFLAHHLWEPIEHGGAELDADVAAVVAVLDGRANGFEQNVEQLKRLRDAVGERIVTMAVLWTHGDAQLSSLLAAKEREELLAFGGVADALVCETADLGALAVFDAIFRGIASEASLGDHFRVVSERA